MTPDELQSCLEHAAEAARRAGAVLLDWRQRFAVREKGRFDLVTDADLASQETIRNYLRSHYPDFGFLGEEDPTAGWKCLTEGRPTWIVDPLDGTTNYVHDCPVYAVSIGLMQADNGLVGVVFDPTRNELFQAAVGGGAWLNGRRLRTSSTSGLDEALLSTGFPPDMRGQEQSLKTWRHFSLRTQSLRRTGSTSLNLVYVAAGRHDAFWAGQAFAWDAAAAVVLIREAGGIVSKPDGTAYDPHVSQILASNGPLHPIMVQELRAASAGS
jgi:myo-inositol-1(or 4)-monophosphatase